MRPKCASGWRVATKPYAPSAERGVYRSKNGGATWEHSKHAHGLETLKGKGFHVDPTCLQCHTTGYGLPGGFDSVRRSAAALGGVGCENCHGPSKAHVADPKVKTPFAARDQCARCHDPENSPAFAYDPYWQRIRHANDVRSARAAPAPWRQSRAEPVNRSTRQQGLP